MEQTSTTIVPWKENAVTHDHGCGCGHDHEHTQVEQGASSTEPISAELDQLACDAIGMALDKLALGEGIWPTLFLLGEDGSAEYFVFEDDGLDVCLVQARASVKELGKDARCYALYYDGFFRGDDDLANNALVVEFAERGMETAYSAIVAYGNPGDESDFWYDEPVAGGAEEMLL